VSAPEREGPPALPGEVWRGADDHGPIAIAIDGGDVVVAWFWDARWWRAGESSGPIFMAWGVAERARAEKAERDLDAYRAADRAGKDTV